jgi:cellobiose phosphorylase
VSSEDDVEVRRLTITNRGAQTREIEVTSYAEIVLARPEDDLAHPGVREAVRRDRVRSAKRRPAVQPPAACGR